MGIGQSRRFAILTRDKFTCQYCGRKAPDVELQVDHVMPRSKGGTDLGSNLVTACFDCNIGKSAVVLPDALAQTLMSAGVAEAEHEAAELEAKQRRYREYQRRQTVPSKPQSQRPIPVAMTFIYIGDDEIFPQFICAACGMLNTHEGDMCGCLRRQQRREAGEFTCEDCGGETDELSYQPYCYDCHSELVRAGEIDDIYA